MSEVKAYDIEGTELKEGDTVAFSYATHKTLAVVKINKIGKIINAGSGHKYIGVRVDLGHTSVWGESSYQMLFLKREIE